ncbi:DUF4381 family protein [Cupriavidus sp. DF5525]|uniref:DUF4381 family protein n=1 Tax=Cupriavidus sp. DF5525 TaxID=3160989 RepID=UPI0003B0BED5|nr:hypothetical protein N234_18095 [Ralstonia pickettii DTP0602]
MSLTHSTAPGAADSAGPVSMAQLADVALPAPPSWAPQTIGWPVAGALLLAALAWAGWGTWRRYRANRYRREALAEVDWFDPATRQPAHSEAAAVKVVVTAARDAGALAPGGSAGALPREGGLPWRTLLWGGVAVLVVLAAALLWRRLEPFVARFRRRLAEHRRARAASPDARPGAVLQACQAGDAAAAYRALGTWTLAAHGTAPTAWTAAAGDAQLADAVFALERRLYGAAATTAAPWDGTQLAGALRRHAAPAPAHRHRHLAPALPPLNP